MGGWELDVATGRVAWTREVYHIHGVPTTFDPSDTTRLVELYDLEDRSKLLAAATACVEQGKPYDLELSLTTPKGRRVIVRTVARPELKDGKVVRVLGSTMDLTVLKEAEEARKEFARQEAEVKRLAELDRMRIEFLNTAAHDLKTPLTPLKLQMATLRLKGNLDPAQRSSLALMDRNLNRFQVMVEDMLDAARLQSGKLKLRRESTILGPLVQEAVASFQESIREADLHVDVNVGPDIRVDADPAKLMQVLMNLISNAVKYTPKGGTIQVRATQEGEEGLVSVRDSGLGMDADQLSRLFQAFVRLHEATPGVAKGTGLGLYISKGIVEQHGGRIWAESPGPGKGSTFFVAWPLAQKEPATKPMAAA